MSAEEVDAWLAAVPRQDFRAALTALREKLRTMLPDHVECLSYKLPGFRQPGEDGKMVAGYGAFTHHLSFFPHSGQIIRQFPDDLAGFPTTKGGINFTPEHPLPDDLLRKLVAARQAEIARRGR